MTFYYDYHLTTIGELLLAGDGQSLSLLGFPEGKMARRHDSHWIRASQPFVDVTRQLDGYFAGELQVFDVQLELAGTSFQQTVWSALKMIPYGETCTYGELAARIGRPRASRAVGAANGVNPVPIIIPCHRVIGSNGSLTGFGGGIRTKQTLLGIESGMADLFSTVA